MTIMKTMSMRSLRASLVLAMSLAMSVGLAACDGDDGDDAATGETGEGPGETGETGETGDEVGGDETGETGDESTLAIIGDYIDDFAGEHSITAELWTMGESSFILDEFDNGAMWVVGRNDDGNEYFPGLWSRFDWTWDADQLYFCQSVFAGEGINDALAGSADAADLAMGCSGFPWSGLTPA